MNRTHLIFIDGLPGSGKSTTAKYIATHLQQCNIPSKWHVEEDADHPVHSRKFKQKYVGREDFAEKCLQSWYDFVHTVTQSNHIFILEGSIFQSTVRFLLEYDSNLRNIQIYFSEFENIVSKLNPLLIYFYQASVNEFLLKTIETRGREWHDKVTNYITNTPYAVCKNLQGIEGNIVFWESYKIICDDLFNASKLMKISIENSAGNWEVYYKEIIEYLNQNIIYR